MTHRPFHILLFVLLLSAATFESIARDTSYVKELLNRSTACQRTDLDSCWVLAEEALVLAERLDFQPGIRGANIRLGSVLMTQGENDAALGYLERALAIDLAAKQYKRAAGDYILLAYAYSAKGAKAKAFSALYEGIRYSALISDTALQIMIYNTLGDLNADYQEEAAALQGYSSALRLAKLSANDNAAAAAYMGIGNVYYNRQAYQEALERYMKADSLGRLTGDEITVAQNMNNIALCFEGLEMYEQALPFFHASLDIYSRFAMASETANAYFNMGNLYLHIREVDSALLYLEKAVSMVLELGELGRLVACYDKLSMAYAAKGDFSKAFQLRLRHSVLNDSLLNTSKVAIISELKTKYETEQKEQKIKLLQVENSVKQRQRNWFLGGTLTLLLVSFLLVFQGRRLRKARNRSNKLLLNILPAEIAEELKTHGHSEARLYNNVSVLFTDFVNFTGISEELSPTELVAEIHQNFTAFDKIIERHGLEKIKTIGDAYMAVCGLPQPSESHAQAVVRAALDINAYMERQSGKFQVRIGIHSGSVVAGIVGIKKYAYDIWGDTVNTAARMEQNSEASKINISEATYKLVKAEFKCVYRGNISVKNKGEVAMYFVESPEAPIFIPSQKPDLQS